MFNIGNKSAGGSKRKRGTTRRKKRRYTQIEEDEPEEELRLSNKKVCVICGNSQEIVDLSSNPIMKKTMASYCEGDDVVSNEVHLLYIYKLLLFINYINNIASIFIA